MSPEFQELLSRYLDGEVDAADVERLSQRLKEDRQAADAFARAATLDAFLEDRFQQDKKALHARGTVASADTVAATRAASSQARFRGVRRPRWSLAAAAAAAFIIAGALLLYLVPSRGPDRTVGTGGGYRLVSGKLVGSGSRQIVEKGSPLVVPADTYATLATPDGSELELEPSSVVAFRGPVGEVREVVELRKGGGSFRITSAQTGFRVDTPVGKILVLGTEFSVKLRPDLDSPNSPEGELSMSHKASLLLAVSVVYGSVQVDIGGETHVLGLGDSRVYAEGGAESVAGTVTVTTDRAPIMVGKEIIATVRKGVVLRVTRVQGNWYWADPPGGWVRKAHAQFARAEEGEVVRETGGGEFAREAADERRVEKWLKEGEGERARVQREVNGDRREGERDGERGERRERDGDRDGERREGARDGEGGERRERDGDRDGDRREGARDGEGGERRERDGDGAEREGAQDRDGGRRGEGEGDESSRRARSKMGKIYNAYDANRDNRVSFTEWLSMKDGAMTDDRRAREKGYYNRADRNRNGSLSYEEFKWYQEVGSRQREGRSDGPREGD